MIDVLKENANWSCVSCLFECNVRFVCGYYVLIQQKKLKKLGTKNPNWIKLCDNIWKANYFLGNENKYISNFSMES
jgi:hypothetical protein